jgi:cobalt-zinc-cadmium efflux system membrane fusion protein
MSEQPGDPEQALSSQELINRRAWPRDRQLKWAAISAVVIVVGILATWFGGRLLGKPAPVLAQSSPPGTFRATPQQLKSLTIMPVELHGFATEEVTDGKIAVNADRATPLFSPYSGRVTRVMAKLGDTVKLGAPLAFLDASEFLQAQNDLATSAAQVKIARINESRKHALYEAKGGSLQDWQQAQADLTTAETALGLVRNRLKIFGRSGSEIAALESVRSMNPTAVLQAPIAGVVVDRQVGVGQYLQAGGSVPVFTIANPTSVWMLANVREADAGLVEVGQAVEVHVLAYPKRAFRARVTYVSASVDAVTHRLPVRAEIDNRDGALKPEMSASFHILTSAASISPAVPASAVVYEGDLAHVWVLAATDLLAYRAVHIGRSSDGLVEVLDGLKGGESIVTQGSLFIDQAAVPASS